MGTSANVFNNFVYRKYSSKIIKCLRKSLKKIAFFVKLPHATLLTKILKYSER